MTAMVVMTLLTDPTPYCVVAEGFLPAGVIRPNVWLHTGSPSTTKATDAEVESVCLSAFRTALRPSLIVVLNDGAGGFLAATDEAWTAGIPPSTVTLATAAVTTWMMRMSPNLSTPRGCDPVLAHTGLPACGPLFPDHGPDGPGHQPWLVELDVVPTSGGDPVARAGHQSCQHVLRPLERALQLHLRPSAREAERVPQVLGVGDDHDRHPAQGRVRLRLTHLRSTGLQAEPLDRGVGLHPWRRLRVQYRAQILLRRQQILVGRGEVLVLRVDRHQTGDVSRVPGRVQAGDHSAEECPTRTYGPGTSAADSRARRSATMSRALRGIATGSLRLRRPSGR